MSPFVVFGMPRSRTAWLARFLTYGEWWCGHEELRHIRSIEDARSWLSQPCTGSAETAAAPFWRLLKKLSPDARVVIVRRPVADVVSSLSRMGDFDPKLLQRVVERAEFKLDQVKARWPGALDVNSADLDKESVCASVFEFCLPYAHDSGWWRACSAVNIQSHAPSIFRYHAAFSRQIEKASKIAKQIMLSDIVTRKTLGLDGFEMKVESFETFYRDCQELFSEHLAIVGESPEAFKDKNLGLLNFLDQNGMMQIVVARSNGKPFGYLMSEISPSRESPNRTSAIHTRFYASKSAPGLGLRLQREAARLLKERGVSEVWGYDGSVGSGPSIGVLYKRIGFERAGTAHRLSLEPA